MGLHLKNSCYVDLIRQTTGRTDMNLRKVVFSKIMLVIFSLLILGYSQCGYSDEWKITLSYDHEISREKPAYILISINPTIEQKIIDNIIKKLFIKMPDIRLNLP